MKGLNHLYQHINILSLDVVAGAVIGSLFFARIFVVTVSTAVLAALALTVWIIYTIDHLRDAKTIRKVAFTDRHRFHQEHFRVVLIILGVAIAADATLVFFVPPVILKLGTYLALVVLAYLIFQRHLKFLKEVFVACLYTAGILLPSIAVIPYDLQPMHYLIIGKFFITALMNLLLFSLFDYRRDRSQQQHSFVTWFSPSFTQYGIMILGLLNIFSGLRLWGFDPLVAFVFITMNLLLLSILFFRKRLADNNCYRMLGDAVFFIPVISLL